MKLEGKTALVTGGASGLGAAAVRMVVENGGRALAMDVNEAAGQKWTVRFAIPLEGETLVHDELRGDIVFKNADVDDAMRGAARGKFVWHRKNAP